MVQNLELAQTSLDKHLKQCTPNLVTSLNWSMQIGEGIFEAFSPEELGIYGIFLIGMKYLHHGAPTAIVHGDLKSLNGM